MIFIESKADRSSAASRPELSSLDLQVRAELVHSLFRQSSRMLYANYPVVALTAMLFWNFFPAVTIIIWVVLSFVLTTFRAGMDWYFLRTLPVGQDAVRWGWIFTFFSFLSGCLWGAIGVIFFTPHDMMITAFICIMVASIVGGSVTLLSAFPPAYYLSAIPTILPFSIYALIYGGELFTVLGVLACICLWVNLVSCRSIYATQRESVMLRFQNLELIQQLTQQKELAETAVRAKTQFLAAASHDLRQPVHALGLFVATLRALNARTELKRSDVENVTDRLQVTLKNLGQLLNGLLHVSRLDAGAVAVSKRSVRLQDVFNNLYNEFSESADAKNIELRIVPTLLWVYTDQVILQRILLNLMSNALRYTRQGKILIGCRRRGMTVMVQVMDTGMGIAADELLKIFQEFYQVQNASRDRAQGLGLGLSIVQRSVHLLGSKLSVASIPGRGSVFAFMLPATLAVLLPQRQKDNVLMQRHDNQSGIVLAIDDDIEILDALELLLPAWGYTVVAVPTLEQALAEADQYASTINFVLADYRLTEDVTGADVIRAVLIRMGRTVPAAIITGDTSPERIREANATGFKLLHKPLDPQEVRILLSEASA